MRTSAQRIRLVLLALLISFISLATAPAQDRAEYQQKVARMLRLVRYTTWPASKLPSSVPFVIGVFASEGVTDVIREAAPRRVQEHDVIVKRCTAVQEVMSCHVVFVARSEQDKMRDILWKTRGEPILTFGDGEGFLERGGIIFLQNVGDTAPFTASTRNLKRSGLTVEPETLAMGTPQ